MIEGLVIKYNRLALREEWGTQVSIRDGLCIQIFFSRCYYNSKRYTYPSREDRPLTPVGELTPIEIGGTTNSRATFHNIKISKDFFKMNKNIINHPIKKEDSIIIFGKFLFLF